MVMPGSTVSVLVANLAPSMGKALCALLDAAGHRCAITSLNDLRSLIASTSAQVVVLNTDTADANGIELMWSLLARESDGGPIILRQADVDTVTTSHPVSTVVGSDHAALFTRVDTLLRNRHKQQALVYGARHQATLAGLITQADLPPVEALAVFDAEGNFVFIDKACETIWGLTREQMSTYRFFDLVHASYSDGASDSLHSVAAATRETTTKGQFMSRHLDSEGTSRHLRCTLAWSPMREFFYCTARSAAPVFDQDKQRQSELVLQGLNRALRMLSACNHAMIRATSEQELLQEVCRIVRSIGGYQMAWVGFAIDDTCKTIVPMARAGDEGWLLDKLVISWSADVAEGYGPSGTTIRSGEPTAIADIATAGTFAPWAQKFLDVGLRAVVCLPLRDARRTYGSFSLYSSEIRAVADEEMALLQELADNIAFGIEARRVDDERRRLRITVEKIAAAVSVTSSVNADDFFRQMALNMVDAVDAQAGFIARFDAAQPYSVQTIAVVSNGIVQANFACPLKRAPFADLQSDHECMQVANAHGALARLIASEADQLQAYVGRRLDNTAGNPIGMLFVLFREPLERIDYILSTLRIIGATVGAEIERQTTDLRLRDQAALLDYATDAIIVRDMDGMVTFWNKGAERLYGWTQAEACGSQMLSRTEGESCDLQEILHLTTRDGEWRGELLQRRKDGNVLPVEARWTLIRNEHGVPLSIMAIETDISQRKSAENKIEHLAFYDLLTDLPNRSLLRDRLQHTLDANDRSGRMGALLGIDLDNFKALNDSFGHDTGDLLLQLVAVRLSTACALATPWRGLVATNS